MHWVDRGNEPAGLASVRTNYTPAWVAYYPRRKGTRPTDDRWRDFQPLLSSRFQALCGYCEEYCHGQVDHFRPKSKYPALVYRWDNWVLACSFCNIISKGKKWPVEGYVDPCAEQAAEYPEKYFEFDTVTGELLPKPGLAGERRERAVQMRDDLDLNHFTHLKSRVQFLGGLRENVRNGDTADPEFRNWVGRVTARDSEFSSLARQFFAERGLL